MIITALKNGVKNIQAVAYNDTRTVNTSLPFTTKRIFHLLRIKKRSNNFWIQFRNFSHSVQPHNRSPKAGLSCVVWYGEISPFPSGSGGDLAPQIRGSSENLSHSHISHAKNREAFLFVYRNK